MGMNRAERRAQWAARARGDASGIEPRRRAIGSGGPVHVHVETLVLHGFSASAGRRVGNAIQQELTRLIGEQGVPSGIRLIGEAVRLDAGSISVRRGAQPAAVGAQIAMAVYGVPAR